MESGSIRHGDRLRSEPGSRPVCEGSLRHGRGPARARMTEPMGLAGPAAPHRGRRERGGMCPNRSSLLAAAALVAGTAPAWAGTTERVSVASGGAQGNAGSFVSSVSADGRFVAFNSFADNLVPGDTNGRGCRRG